MFLAVLIAEIIFWSPCIVMGILAVCVDPWYWSGFTAIIAFWAGPLTPAVLLQLGLATAIKKLLDKIFKKKKQGELKGD